MIGMNPSPRFPKTSWHPEAESTRILAEFAVGDAEMTCYLEDGLELDNLNPAIPEGADKKMFVDVTVARERLDNWARQGRLHDRLVVLLGDQVARVFTTWAEIEPVPGDGASHIRSSPRLAGVEIRLARIPHPSRIARLRRSAPDNLESAEICFRSLGAIYKEGEAIAFAERLEIDRKHIEEDERVTATLIVMEQNMLLREEENAEARQSRLEARRELRLERFHVQFDGDDIEE
ncbi:hypothetical protein [Sphingomonas qomolangmaensis]|uniref:Uncharacterized protein n=1 Tax=Sphingomonas qomolangmaensis TaxID=2918765 RepID=A0ABY5L7Y5_9SPHN|nr:hypothetical protein [Sphingomonas qomolangmaensis]UUL82552.1 hypothetical protein NMP03_15500 [Sphingomonas qomolangmaensis]